jgi:hypothetical protein
MCCHFDTNPVLLPQQDLKHVLKKAGLEGQEVVFLFNDTQILHEGFLEDLNNILNAGAWDITWPKPLPMYSYDSVRPNGLLYLAMHQAGISTDPVQQSNIHTPAYAACACRGGARPVGL